MSIGAITYVRPYFENSIVSEDNFSLLSIVNRDVGIHGIAEYIVEVYTPSKGMNLYCPVIHVVRGIEMYARIFK